MIFEENLTNEHVMDLNRQNMTMDHGVSSELINELFIVVFATFVLLILLDVIKPHKRIKHKLLLSSFKTNAYALIFNNIFLAIVSASSLFLIAQEISGYGVLGSMALGWEKWILSFILFDFSIYLWHVANHQFEWLWRFHKIHHSDRSLNVTTGFRFHVVDLSIELVYKSIVIVILGIDAYTILVLELVKTIFVMFHHCNIKVPKERLLSRIIIVPSLHRTHHSRIRSEHDSNYGIVLSVWDFLFGTRVDVIPQKIGLKLIAAENFLQLFCLAFITERRMAKLINILPRSVKEL